MSGRRLPRLLGITVGTALATVPVMVVAVLIIWDFRTAGPDRAEARKLFQARARAVAAAWAAPPDSAWRTGFVPLQGLTLPPASIRPYSAEEPIDAYVLSVELPTRQPAQGRVSFTDGGTMTLPLVPAGQAFSALGDPDCGPGLLTQSGTHCIIGTVTAVRLAEVRVQTGRGLAAVPAWLFTVAERPAPVARVAVEPESIGNSPTPTLQPASSRLDLVTANPFRIDEVTANEVRFWFYPACAPTVGAVAYETADSVVLGVQVERPWGHECFESYPELTTVTLSKPVGSRLLLGIDGTPIPMSGKPLATPAIRPN